MRSASHAEMSVGVRRRLAEVVSVQSRYELTQGLAAASLARRSDQASLLWLVPSHLVCLLVEVVLRPGSTLSLSPPLLLFIRPRKPRTKMATVLAGKRLVVTAAHAKVGVSHQQTRSLYGVYEKYMEAYKRYGWKLSLWKLYNPGDIKFGYKVGEDQFGNQYYEDPTDLVHQQRYTEFKVNSFNDFEGSNIPPEWHMWMQQITDAPPGTPGQDPANWPKVPISSVSHAPYANHVGPTKPYQMHATMKRSRGYGVGSILTKPEEPDQYYVQPGHALRRRQRKNDFFDEIDYNNPNKPPANSSESLRPLDQI